MQIKFYKKRADQKGVTMIEYALIAALVAVAAIAALTLVGDQLIIIFTYIKNALTITP